MSIIITQQPQSQSVNDGDRVVFTVSWYVNTIFGGFNTTYQWYKDGSVIPGATRNKYVIESVTSSMSGAKFHCIITADGFGTAKTDTATLTVSGYTYTETYDVTTPDTEYPVDSEYISVYQLIGGESQNGYKNFALNNTIEYSWGKVLNLYLPVNSTLSKFRIWVPPKATIIVLGYKARLEGETPHVFSGRMDTPPTTIPDPLNLPEYMPLGFPINSYTSERLGTNVSDYLHIVTEGLLDFTTGKWLYINLVQGSSPLTSLAILTTITQEQVTVFDNWFNATEWDAYGDPIYSVATERDKTNPEVPQETYEIDYTYQSLHQSESPSGLKNKIATWDTSAWAKARRNIRMVMTDEYYPKFRIWIPPGTHQINIFSTQEQTLETDSYFSARFDIPPTTDPSTIVTPPETTTASMDDLDSEFIGRSGSGSYIIYAKGSCTPALGSGRWLYVWLYPRETVTNTQFNVEVDPTLFLDWYENTAIWDEYDDPLYSAPVEDDGEGDDDEEEPPADPEDIVPATLESIVADVDSQYENCASALASIEYRGCIVEEQILRLESLKAALESQDELNAAEYVGMHLDLTPGENGTVGLRAELESLKEAYVVQSKNLEALSNLSKLYHAILNERPLPTLPTVEESGMSTSEDPEPDLVYQNRDHFPAFRVDINTGEEVEWEIGSTIVKDGILYVYIGKSESYALYYDETGWEPAACQERACPIPPGGA